MKQLWIIFFLFTLSNAVAAKESQFQAPVFNNLGSYHHPISTKNPDAQRFFDQGMVLFYGFEWSESIRSFREAARLDPNCGMCYWGLAMALGNKINAPMNGNEYRDAKAAIQKALSLSQYETIAERNYIKALALRFQHSPKKIKQVHAFSCHPSPVQQDKSTDKEKLAYANAMKKFIKKYPRDIDAKVLYGGELFWSISGKNVSHTNPRVIAAEKILKKAMVADKYHIGANHYYIHVVEPIRPQNALVSAHLFRKLVPGSEHLIHMPTHIYFLTGRYHLGSDSNVQAIKVFHEYNKTCRDQGFVPEINYLYFHNYDFLRSTAAMEGRKNIAVSAAKQIVAEPFPTWLKNEDALQWFIPISYFVNARFAKWDDLLKEPMPKEKYSYALGMWHYARGLAFAEKGNASASEDEAKKLQAIIGEGKAESNLGESGLTLLKIANAVLVAVIADSGGNENATISNLKNASKLQDSMGYHEPPDWYFPVKQALGDAYLKWNHPREAKKMYEEDLRQYPKNAWSLYGLANSLRALGDTVEAEHMEEAFRRAWKYADISRPINLFNKKLSN